MNYTLLFQPSPMCCAEIQEDSGLLKSFLGWVDQKGLGMGQISGTESSPDFQIWIDMTAKTLNRICCIFDNYFKEFIEQKTNQFIFPKNTFS